MGEIKLETMLAGSLMREHGVPQGVAKTGLVSCCGQACVTFR